MGDNPHAGTHRTFLLNWQHVLSLPRLAGVTRVHMQRAAFGAALPFVFQYIIVDSHLGVLPFQPLDLAAKVLNQLEPVKSVQHSDGCLSVELASDTRDFSFLARALIENRFQIQELREEEVNLETAFMRLTKGIVQ